MSIVAPNAAWLKVTGPLADQVLAVALEEAVLADADGELQVAAGRPGVAGVAHAGEADAVSGVHAGGDFDLDGAGTDGPARALAGGARVGDDLAGAVAAAARRLDLEEALLLDDDPLAAAALATRRLATRLGPGAAARLAGVLALDGDLLLDALGRLDQLDVEDGLQVLAALRPGPPPAAPPAAAEERAEEVAEQVAEIDPAPAAHPAAVGERGVPVPVVQRPLLLVGEDFVGLGRLLELVGRLGVAGVAVRVPLHGDLAVRLLDLVARGRAGDGQNLVVVALSHAVSERVSAVAAGCRTAIISHIRRAAGNRGEPRA